MWSQRRRCRRSARRSAPSGPRAIARPRRPTGRAGGGHCSTPATTPRSPRPLSATSTGPGAGSCDACHARWNGTCSPSPTVNSATVANRCRGVAPVCAACSASGPATMASPSSAGEPRARSSRSPCAAVRCICIGTRPARPSDQPDEVELVAAAERHAVDHRHAAIVGVEHVSSTRPPSRYRRSTRRTPPAGARSHRP